MGAMGARVMGARGGSGARGAALTVPIPSDMALAMRDKKLFLDFLTFLILRFRSLSELLNTVSLLMGIYNTSITYI